METSSIFRRNFRWWRILGFLATLSSAWNPVYAQGTATETIGMQINIEPTFFVETTTEQGGDVQLGPILPGENPAAQSVKVFIRTNQGRPYRVIQRLEQKLLSERGLDFPAEQIQLVVSEGIHGGRSEVKGPRTLPTDTLVIFSSSPDGNADEFTITYLSSSKQVVPAGTYRSRIQIEGELR